VFVKPNLSLAKNKTNSFHRKEAEACAAGQKRSMKHEACPRSCVVQRSKNFLPGFNASRKPGPQSTGLRPLLPFKRRKKNNTEGLKAPTRFTLRSHSEAGQSKSPLQGI